MTALYQVKTIRQIENAVYQQNIATDWELMERAGLTAFHTLKKTWPQIKRIIVMCGKGNNGGDGFVLAKEAHLAGFSVVVYHLVHKNDYQGAAKTAFEHCSVLHVPCELFQPNTMLSGDLIVDALLGTGLHDKIDELTKTAVQAINAAKLPVLAIDVPSGLNADTGAVHGAVVKASVTQTFIGLKPGLFTHHGSTCCGKIFCDELGIPSSVFTRFSKNAELMDESKISHWFSLRRRDAYKGNFGHVLVIGGDTGMLGAVRMTAEASLRVGAGLVTVATHPEHAAMVSSVRPEIMSHGITKAKELAPFIEKASVIVLGPGLGQSKWSKALFQFALRSHQIKVIDADGLNLLAQSPSHHEKWILTPHPGEAGRLLEITALQIQQNRFESAKEIITRYGGVCALKGTGTIVQDEYHLPAVCRLGNPGMASAGMGDVLSGVIAGLLAQGFSLFDAASIGVMIHAKAGDLAAQSGGERGLLATDLMLTLRYLVNPEQNQMV